MIRLRELRESKGLNMREASRLLGMPYTTYVNYEKGLREPTSETLILFSDFFGTSVDYLVGRDRSPAHLAKTAPVPPPSNLTLSKEEERMVHKFRCLDERGQAAVLNVLNYEYDSLPGEKANSPAKEA